MKPTGDKAASGLSNRYLKKYKKRINNMGQAADHCGTIKEMLKKHKGHELAVIETFYETITNQSWQTEDIIDFLEQAKGISQKADDFLDIFIGRERQWTT